jgi:hypothetical protein
MKKSVNKLALKTDKILILSKEEAFKILGGRPPVPVSGTCPCTGLCSDLMC